MGVMHRITTTIENFKGLEKRRSDLIDKPGYFNELKNAAIRPSGALNKRKGYHTIASNIPATNENLTENELGIAAYPPSNELLVMNKNLKKIVEEKITITNNSATADVLCSFLPNQEHHLEYMFRSRATGVTVDIGVGDESADNPGELVTTEDTIATETLTVQVPAQTKTFIIRNSANSAVFSNPEDDHYCYFTASQNVFGSQDFRKGISCFYAGDIGHYGTFDYWEHFRIDFTDGSYIYTRGESTPTQQISYRTLVYKDAENGIEKKFKAAVGSAPRHQPNSGMIVNQQSGNYYVKTYFAMGPVNGYSAGVQTSNSGVEIPTWQTALTAENGASWEDLNFTGKTISRCTILKNDFRGLALSSVEIPDVAAFGTGEKYPALFPRTAYDQNNVVIPQGSRAIEDCFKVNYDRFFLFGNGDNDNVSGQWDPFNKITGSTLVLASHGDNAAVRLTPTIQFVDGQPYYLIPGLGVEETVFAYYKSYSQYFQWASVDDQVSYWRNYFNPSTTVEREIQTATDSGLVSTSSLTSPYTISDLINNINSFTHVNLTATPSDSSDIANIPAAYAIPFDTTLIPKGESIDIRYFREVDVTKGDSNYNYFNNLHTDFINKENSFQNVSHTLLNNNIYFATGVDEICKYDGNKIYRAGLPVPNSNNLSATNETEVSSFNTGDVNIGVEEDNDTATTSYYMTTFKHVDNNGNVIQSTQSVAKKLTGATHQSSHRHLVEVQIPTIMHGSGFSVDDIDIVIWRAPHTTTEEVKDASSFYQVTTGDSSLTHTMTYADWLTLNLTIADYVNVTLDMVDPADQTTWQVVIDNNLVDNYKYNTSLKYLDYLPDEVINVHDFITTSDYAEGRHDLPPKAKYITNHQGCLVLAGTEENPNEIFYSLPEFNFITGEIGSEYFPNNSNSVIVPGANGTNVTGMKTLRESLLVFNEKSISVLSGDLTTTGVQYLKKDALTAQGEQGSLSSNSVQEWEGTLTFLSQEGILSTNSNLSYPKEMSETIKPLMLNKKFDRKRAISFFTADQDVIGFFIPVKDEDHINDATKEGIFNDSFSSRLFVYDVKIDGWIEWDNIDMSGGVARHNNETYFLSRLDGRISLHIFKTAADKSAYSDFSDPINTTLVTSWDSLGNSSLFKKFIRLKVFCTDSQQKFEGNKFTLNLYLRSNFDNNDIGPITLDPGTFGGWGIPEWGDFSWGARDFKGIRTKLFGKSKAIALHFNNNNINENILMSGYAMEVASPYAQEIKE